MTSPVDAGDKNFFDDSNIQWQLLLNFEDKKYKLDDLLQFVGLTDLSEERKKAEKTNSNRNYSVYRRKKVEVRKMPAIYN